VRQYNVYIYIYSYIYTQYYTSLIMKPLCGTSRRPCGTNFAEGPCTSCTPRHSPRRNTYLHLECFISICYFQSAHPFGFIRQLVSYASPVLLPSPHLPPAMGSEQPATQTQAEPCPIWVAHGRSGHSNRIHIAPNCNSNYVHMTPLVLGGAWGVGTPTLPTGFYRKLGRWGGGVGASRG